MCLSLYSLLAAFESFRVLKSVAGDTPFTYVAHIGEDGVYQCCSVEPTEHTESMSLDGGEKIAFSLVGSVAVVIILCAFCHICCKKRETNRKVNRSTIQLVNEHPIQLNVCDPQQAVSQPVSATVIRCPGRPVQLNIHDLQQAASQPVSAAAVRGPEKPTAPSCSDADPPPAYEVAVACESNALKFPPYSAYKQ